MRRVCSGSGHGGSGSFQPNRRLSRVFSDSATAGASTTAVQNPACRASPVAVAAAAIASTATGTATARVNQARTFSRGGASCMAPNLGRPA
ncbi:MAG: hypothetical protein ACOY5Y_15855 [Pseudomonadota bacterium]